MAKPLILLLLIPVVFAACVLLTMVMGLPTLYQAIITGAVMMAYLCVFLFVLLSGIRGMARRHDDLFAEAGLESARWVGVGRRYEGTLAGRAATAGSTIGYRFEPARVELSVSVNTGCRFALGWARPLLDCRQGERLRLPGRFAKLHVYAEDVDDAWRRLDKRTFSEPLESLLDDLGVTSSWELYLQPDRIWLRTRSYRYGGEVIRRWIGKMSVLAEGCEKLTTPAP